MTVEPHCIRIDPVAQKIAKQTRDVAKDIENLSITRRCRRTDAYHCLQAH